MRKLACPCEQVFNYDFPDSVNLDSNPEIIRTIEDGSFLSCVCPACNTVLHTDLKTRIEWPSKKTNLLLIPEIDRLSYLAGSLPPEDDAQIVIGFAELADRIAVIGQNLDPLVIESIKYHLALKAGESNSEAGLTILFEKKNEKGDIEFHIHGIKPDEVALTLVPAHVYDAIRKDILENPDKEPYASLKKGPYMSVQNLLEEDTQND
jgi:hypothetical protein